MKLTLHTNSLQPARYAFDARELPVRIGRSLEAEIRADDRWVSRFHCQLEYQDGQVIVCDLDSKHGTFVNGRSIDRATLAEGDELRVGLSAFIVACSDESNVGAPSLAHGEPARG